MKKKSTPKRTGKKADAAPKRGRTVKKTAEKGASKPGTARKKAAKKPVSKKKTATKSAPAKKKSTRKKAVKKAATPKESAGKVPAKKAGAKKAVAEKATVKKAPAKKKAAKKAPARKKATEKASAKKKAVARPVPARSRTLRSKAIPPTAARMAASKKGRRADGKLTAKALKKLRAVLLVLHAQLTGQAKALKTASLRREDDVYSPEDGSDVFERIFGLSVASSELDSVFEIEEALRRMDDGTYGLCEVCEGKISVPRLEAVPFVRTCIECQSAIEKGKIHYRPI